jgi:hypothetical protein
MSNHCRVVYLCYMSDLISEVQRHIDRAGQLLCYAVPHPTTSQPIIKEAAFVGFRSGVLSFIQHTYGTSHSYYSEFNTKVVHANEEDTKRAMEILKAIKLEIEHSGGTGSTSRHKPKTDVRILGLKQEVFWPLLVAVVTGSFILGFDLGGAKFDHDKIELYETNRALRHRDTLLTVQVNESHHIIMTLEDSVKHVNNSLKAVLTYGTQPIK